MMKRIVLSCCLTIITLLSAYGQELLRGKVIDGINSLPLAGVNIQAGDQIFITDKYGSFLIQDIGNADTLTFSFIGYHDLKINRKNFSDDLSVAMLPTNLELHEIVVTALGENKNLYEVPASVGLITKRELDRGDGVIIAPAINRIPGVYMHSGAYNTNRLTIRGIGSRSLFSTNRIRAYFDNIPLTTGEGETTIEDIDLSLVDRVEVIKGPSSSIYGAGLGGTVVLESSKAPFGQKEVFHRSTAGYYGLYRQATGFRSGSEKANLSVVYNSVTSNGYRNNNEYDRSSISAIGRLYSSPQTSVSFLVNVIDLKAFIPSAIDSATFAENPRAAAFTWQQTRGFENYNRGLLGATIDHEISKAFRLNASVFSNFRNADELRPFDILLENTNAIGTRNRISYTPLQDGIVDRVELGFEYFKEWYDWQTFENDDRNPGANLSDNREVRDYYNIFGQVNASISERTKVTFGVNINRTQYRLTDLFVADSIDQSGTYSFDLTFSPRVALAYQLTDKDNLYATVSHGFSPPELSETLTPEGLINPDIQPETGYNYEIGYKGLIFNSRLSVDVSVYSMQIRNLLVARRTAEDQFVGINAGKTEHNGLEAALNYNFIASKSTIFKSLTGFANFTYADYNFIEFIDGEQDFSGNQLTGTPPTTINSGFDFEMHSGFYGNINYQFVDAFPMRDDNSIFSDAYHVVNLQTGYRHQFFNRLSVDINLGINNLFDETYASQILVNASSFGGNAPRYFYPGLPFNMFGGVGLSYGF
ncbi:MAG: TonB-dependent receptor [Bacteroidota bacterium]